MSTENKETSSGSQVSVPTLIDSKELASLYGSGNFEGLIDRVCQWLQQFSQTQLKEVPKDLRKSFDSNAETLGYFLSRPDLNFKQSSLLKLIRSHQALANVFSNSSYKNADHWIKPRINNRKVSPLYLPLLVVRNELTFNRSHLVEQNQSLVSEWYGQYFFGTRSFINKNVLENLREHLSFWDPRMECCISISNGYMRSTYIDPSLDRLWKFNFNKLVKEKFSRTTVTNKANRKSIAVLTARWASVHPTYKNRLPLFEALSKEFDLTLVHLGPSRRDIDTTLFKKVINVSFRMGRISSPELFNNDFAMAFYPDIGMNVESRFLSNLRLAPVQVTSNSHPVSTFGSEIDFFITGASSEEHPSEASRHYSERLVLLPGIGTLPVMPTVQVPKAKQVDSAGGETIVCCPWGSLKVNHALVEALEQVKVRSRKRIKFRFLMTLGADSGHLPPIYEDLVDHLGREYVELFADLPYPEYMTKFSECDLALDAFPFGGNTSIIDSVFLKKPMVSRVGWQFYNRAGPEILKLCGLENLCAVNENTFINQAVRLIDDIPFYNSIIDILNAVDLQKVLSQLSSAPAFVEACRYLIHERPDPKIRTPLSFS